MSLYRIDGEDTGLDGTYYMWIKLGNTVYVGGGGTPAEARETMNHTPFSGYSTDVRDGAARWFLSYGEDLPPDEVDDWWDAAYSADDEDDD